MSEIRPLGFESNQFPVTLTLNSGQTYQVMTIDWLSARAGWPAANGVMVEVKDPATGAPEGQKLKVWVPWWNIKFITQVVPAPVQI